MTSGSNDFDYVVTGLPRCGLGWISSFLSYGSLGICHSEAVSRSLVGLVNAPPRMRSRVTGNADPFYLLIPERIPDQAKVVLVVRDPHSIRSSMGSVGMNLSIIDSGEANASKIMQMDGLALVVRYEQLFANSESDRLGVCKLLWSAVYGDSLFDDEHYFRCSALHVNAKAIK